MAQENAVYVIGGSFPELIEDSDKIYNSCCCFDRNGELKLKHRKQHLMDVNIPGGVVFQESVFTVPG